MTIDNLEKKIENLLEYFSEYPNETNKQNLNKIQKDLNNQEYKIAVVANMSSGKSTFINALFGIEVLPAFNHATTDSATFIHSEADIEKRAIIYFNDKKKKVEIKDELEKEIKQYAQKDEECKDDKYKNVEKIKLYYPFKNLQTSSNKDFKITFIDTPGPNSTGESYKQKHKDQTRSVLNDVDLALFMFDYTQLDANLSSDEQGLWNTIKKRYDKDKNFNVYFLLNKIDYAFDDNFKEVKSNDEARDRWFFHERLAVEKLTKAAKKHEILNPKIYPISSKYQLLNRHDDSWDSPLESFEKKFKNLFSHNWEEKCIEYIGISKLENDINTYINTSVKDKILTKISSQINNIYYSERERLEVTIQTLEKPKEEAEENLKKAKKFLNGQANKMENRFKEESLDFQRKYVELIRQVINDNIEKELNKNIKEATNRTIKFLELLLEDHSKQDAINAAKNLPLTQITNYLEQETIRIKVEQEFKVDEIENNLQWFIISILNDYKNNYLDMKIDIKNNYSNMKEEVSDLFNKYKVEFNKQLKHTLEVESINLDESLLCKESSFNDKIAVPNSTIEYKYQSERWEGKDGSFSSREKVRDEEHSILISPKKIEKIFKSSIDSIKRSYLHNEIETYEETIVSFITSYQENVNNFKKAKKQEIEQIEKDVENRQQNLKIILTQYQKLLEGER